MSAYTLKLKPYIQPFERQLAFDGGDCLGIGPK